MTDAVMLSIDWDFFPWNGGEALDGRERITVFPGTDREQSVAAINFFDWGHSEGHSMMLQNIMWATRWGAFKSRGLCPEEVAGINTSRGCTDPSEFLKVLESRFDLDTHIQLADSHAMGIRSAENAAMDLGYPVKLILFDAHSDLGYDEDDVDRQVQEGICECGSWVYHALRAGYVQEVLVVYPDWRGLFEWEPFTKYRHLLQRSK